jgi:hypothetical protein
MEHTCRCHVRQIGPRVSRPNNESHTWRAERNRGISVHETVKYLDTCKVRLTTELDRRARPNNQTDAILGCFRPMFVKRPPTNAGFDEQAHCEHVEVGPRSVFQCARWNNAAQVESPRTSCCGSPVFPCLTGTFSTRSLSTLSVEKHQHINTSNHQNHQNHQTIKPSNHQTIKPSKHQTIKPSNHQTIKTIKTTKPSKKTVSNDGVQSKAATAARTTAARTQQHTRPRVLGFLVAEKIQQIDKTMHHFGGDLFFDVGQSQIVDDKHGGQQITPFPFFVFKTVPTVRVGRCSQMRRGEYLNINQIEKES